MNDSNPIDAAAKRLATALESLDAALERRQMADGREASLTDQVAVLGADRSQLAAELDMHAARAQRLDTANREVSRRLDVAMESVRSVIERHER